jgi:uncharacterized membrane protein
LPENRRVAPSRWIPALLMLMMLGYAAFFSVQLSLHYYSFGSRALDLGNMGQTIWNTAHGNLFHQTNQPGATSRLSLHVEPMMLPVSLLYWLYPSPEILFIFESVVVALGAIPVFALTRRQLGSEGLALAFAAVYLLFPALQAATLLDFHAVTLAPSFLLAAFYYIETNRPRRFALFAILSVACKEEITLLILMMGLYALLVNRQKWLGLLTIAAALGWVGLAVFVIPPMFAGTENIHWSRYDHLGDGALNIVLNLFLQPQLFITHLLAVDALGYVRLLLAPTAYLALLSPLTLLLAAPSLGINLLSSFPPMQRVNSLIYAAPIVPAVMISSIYGAAHLRRFVLWGLGRIPAFRPPPVSVLNFLLGAMVLTASLVYQFYFGYFPGGGQYRGWETVTAHDRLAERVFAQIPAEAKLSAMDRLNPHVSGRETLYIFDRIDDADHILLDVTQDSWPLHPVALRDRVTDFLANGFGVVEAVDGYLLLAKNRPDLPTTLPDGFYSFARVSNPDTFAPQFPTPARFGDSLELLGYDLSLGDHEKFLPVITLYWRALKPIDADLNLWPHIINRNGQLIDSPAEHPLVTTIWYPTSRWQPGEIIRTPTLPVDLAPAIGDEFTVVAGVVAGDWADAATRLTVITESNLPLYERNTWLRLGSFQRTGRKEYQPLAPAEQPPSQPRQAEFWDLITLTGTDLPQPRLTPGETLPFTLHWQSRTPLTVDLTTFAHLRDAAGHVAAQLDWGPQDAAGYRPTSSWRPGQPVIDSQHLPLPADLPPGDYSLVVGWYYAPTGERLPLTQPDGPAAPDNTVTVGTVTVAR